MILKFLRGWALKHNITHAAISDLLVGLKENDQCFADDQSEPKFPIRESARTLLKTRRTMLLYIVHIGLKKQLLKIARKYLKNVSIFKLLINIDGLPLFKSSSAQVYPILCIVVSIPELPVVNRDHPGIYYGKEKPDNLNNYLQDFIEEINNLMAHGFHFEDHTIFLDGTYFVCDAPAKSYVMGTVSYTGFSSCIRCTVRGVTSYNRRIFVDLESPARTCEDFLEGSSSHSIDQYYSLDFVHHFILDYLRLQCLDVMRTMILNMWYKGPIPHRLSATQIEMLSNHLVELQCQFPVEFVRKCRELFILLQWKRTEFRLFMLYVGPVVLKNILSEQKFVHFLEFHCAMRILLIRICAKNGSFCVLCCCVSFDSENATVKPRDHIFHKLFSPHNAGPVLSGCRRQYRDAALSLFKITNNAPDNCCGTADGEIIQVANIAFSDHLQFPVVIGKKFVSKRDFYNVPIENSRVGIFKVEQLSNLKAWPLSQITIKYVQLPYKTAYIVSSILHCDAL
ncbi:hypothetical protein ALC57_09060 [Trachymyrmex cornetzi]|uniref:Uncharacterized protein n=1 Tax=Trachymyrmex cornetzi TaxID=471704 RepID=A0A151J689_9HYME|nr:hypothetical protein ALC57_09060 [Trachymyrmex cornetzi]